MCLYTERGRFLGTPNRWARLTIRLAASTIQSFLFLLRENRISWQLSPFFWNHQRMRKRTYFLEKRQRSFVFLINCDVFPFERKAIQNKGTPRSIHIFIETIISLLHGCVLRPLCTDYFSISFIFGTDI